MFDIEGIFHVTAADTVIVPECCECAKSSGHAAWNALDYNVLSLIVFRVADRSVWRSHSGPMSANTTAKIAYGVADSLLTNGTSQAAKAKIPIYICPADQYEGSVTTILPDGKEMTLYT